MSRFASLVLTIALAFPAAQSGFAQSYPTRAIKLVVGQAPGGPSDVVGRIVAERLAEILQQPVVIENRGGAGGTIGAEMVARAPHDGYTLLVGGASNLALGSLAGAAQYDPMRDFVPIGGVAAIPYAVAVRPGVPATTLQELLAYARDQSGRLDLRFKWRGQHVEPCRRMAQVRGWCRHRPCSVPRYGAGGIGALERRNRHDSGGPVAARSACESGDATHGGCDRGAASSRGSRAGDGGRARHP